MISSDDFGRCEAAGAVRETGRPRDGCGIQINDGQPWSAPQSEPCCAPERRIYRSPAKRAIHQNDPIPCRRSTPSPYQLHCHHRPLSPRHTRRPLAKIARKYHATGQRRDWAAHLRSHTPAARPASPQCDQPAPAETRINGIVESGNHGGDTASARVVGSGPMVDSGRLLINTLTDDEMTGPGS